MLSDKELQALEDQHSEMYKKVSEVWSEIRSFLMSLGLKGDNIAYSKEKLLQGSNLNVAYEWLVLFRDREIATYKKTLKLVPDTVWAAHKAFNNKRAYEVKKLAADKKAVISMWKTRPSILWRPASVKDARTKDSATGKGYTNAPAKVRRS